MNWTRRIVIVCLLASLLMASASVEAGHRPGHKPTPTPTTVTRIIRFYDATDRYSPAVQYAANYYRNELAPIGAQVQYIRLSAMTWAQCWGQPVAPDDGIIFCEGIGQTSGTSGSTAAVWVQETPGVWEVNAYSGHVFSQPEHDFGTGSPGMAGRYMTCHEVGHILGNLPHRTLQPHSCMSAVGSYAWDYLIPPEVDTTRSVVLQRTSGTAPAEARSAAAVVDVSSVDLDHLPMPDVTEDEEKPQGQGKNVEEKEKKATGKEKSVVGKEKKVTEKPKKPSPHDKKKKDKKG